MHVPDVEMVYLSYCLYAVFICSPGYWIMAQKPSFSLSLILSMHESYYRYVHETKKRFLLFLEHLCFYSLFFVLAFRGGSR